VNEPSWTWISDKIALAPSGFLDETSRGYRYRYDPNAVYVVQGGVPYKVDKDKLSDEGKGLYNTLPLNDYEVVLIAPIGSIQFTPSREAIYYTNDTNAAIESLFQDYRREVGKFVTAKVAGAKDRTDALRTFEKFRNITPSDVVVTWQNQTVPASVPADCFATDTAKRASGTRYKNLPTLAQMESYALVVYGATDSQITDKGSYTLRVSAAGYLTGSYALADRWYGRGSHKDILVIKGDLPEGFDWYGIKAVEVGTLRPKSGRVKGQSQAKTEYQDREWAVVGAYGKMTKVDPDDEQVIYVDAEGRYKIKSGSVPAGYTVVMVPGNQHARFAREFPKAMTRQEAVQKAAKDAKVVFTEADATFRRGNLFHYGRLTEKQIAEILDPDLRTVLEWINKKPAGVVKMEKINSDLAWLNISADVVTAATPTYDKMEKRYGFLRGLDHKNLVDTLNALYVYKYQGGTK
jgi:hypothetical protein